MSTESWYLAGPMGNVPQHNFPLFDFVAAQLRECGLTIISPAELDDPAVRTASLASVDGAVNWVNGTWGDFLSRDVKVVADNCTGIILLPGWQKSRGARLEAYVGLMTGRHFAEYIDNGLRFVSSDYIRGDLIRNMP